MNKATIFIFALLATSLLTLTVFIINSENQNLEVSSQASCVQFPYYTYYDDSEIQGSITWMYSKSIPTMISTAQGIAQYGFKFITVDQIVKLLQTFLEGHPQSEVDGYTNILTVIKQYIPQMSTQQALQILQVSPTPQNTDMSAILAPLICDLNTNTLAQISNSFTHADYFVQNYFQPAILSPFTFNGSFFGCLIYDTSDPMFSSIKLQDGTSSNRWNQLVNFYQNYGHLTQYFDVSMMAPTSLKSNLYPSQNYYHKSSGIRVDIVCPTSSQKPEGELDLNSVFTGLLQNPFDRLTDVFLFTSGLGSDENNNNVVSIVNSSNSQRYQNVRVNVVAFIQGDNITKEQQEAARNRLQRITSLTSGTYIEINY